MSTATERDRWARILQELARTVPSQQYETWFRGLELRSLNEQRIELDVPSKFAKDWLVEYYLKTIREAARSILNHPPEVVFSVRTASASQLPTHTPPPAGAPAGAAAPARPAAHSPFNPRFTFDTFVVGENNRLAHAAAKQVSMTPGRGLNPLFIYGAVGLGKTHLLQAICHAAKAQNPAARIAYLSCEAFVNDYISAVAGGTLEAFRHRVRQIDFLLIDDVHFLSNKEASQEEFHHTFNTLYLAQKQIVLSSDSAPKDITALTDALKSRFVCGLYVPIDKPSFETRCAIIRKKGEERGTPVPDDICLYVGTLFDTNIRELEGAVTKLSALAALHGRPVDMAMAQEAFRGAGRPERVRLRIEDIQRIIVERFGLTASDLQSKRRLKSIAFPRQVCMYLARKLTEHSLEEIGAYFGGRDHTTVMYACQQIEERRAKDQQLDLLLEETVQKLKHLPS